MKGFESSTAIAATNPTLMISYPITLGATRGVPNVVHAPIRNIPTMTVLLPSRS